MSIVVQQRNVKGHGKWTTRWEFPHTAWTRANRNYDSLNAHDGWAKRIALRFPSGTLRVIKTDKEN